MEGFIYVVNPPKIPKVCFGSGVERVTLPVKGPALSSFMRRNAPEVREFPGPADYNVARTLEKNFPSKLGFSQLVSKIPRLPPTNLSKFPPIGAYDVDVRKPFKREAKPFGMGAKLDGEPPFLTPSPTAYPYHLPRHREGIKISSAFGSRRIIWPEVAVVCAPYNSAKCFKCGQMPRGDYWHCFKPNQDMCRICMGNIVNNMKSCATNMFQRMRTRRDLENYCRMRYCSFFHDHNGTTAATQLISKKRLRDKIKMENYLMLFYNELV